MKIQQPYKRLQTLWGMIDRQHNAIIAGKIKGRKILDIGCGYGSLVDYLKQLDFDAEGIDNDKEVHRIAATLYPDAPLHLVSAEEIRSYADATFDTVILKDSFHHIVGEGDIRSALRNIRKMLKDGGRIIIFDPNPMWILRTARRIVAHIDPEANLDVALRILNEEGFKVKGTDFFEILGLPLSGGYVGIRFVPNWSALTRLIAAANAGASAIVNKLGLSRQLCWRYCVYADKTNEGGS